MQRIYLTANNRKKLSDVGSQFSSGCISVSFIASTASKCVLERNLKIVRKFKFLTLFVFLKKIRYFCAYWWIYTLWIVKIAYFCICSFTSKKKNSRNFTQLVQHNDKITKKLHKMLFFLTIFCQKYDIFTPNGQKIVFCAKWEISMSFYRIVTLEMYVGA